MTDQNIETMQVIEVTLHPQKEPRLSALAQVSLQPILTLLPISSIANFKKIQNADYEIFIKQGCLPHSHFAIGQITATFPSNALSVLNQR